MGVLSGGAAREMERRKLRNNSRLLRTFSPAPPPSFHRARTKPPATQVTTFINCNMCCFSIGILPDTFVPILKKQNNIKTPAEWGGGGDLGVVVVRNFKGSPKRNQNIVLWALLGITSPRGFRSLPSVNSNSPSF